MSDFIRELEEDFRRDRAYRLVSKYWSHAVVVAVIFVIAVAGYSGYKSYMNSIYQKEATKYFEAMKLEEKTPGKTEESRKKLAELAESGKGGYALLAGITAAAQEYDAGDKEAAEKLLMRVMEKSPEPAISGIAEYMIKVSNPEHPNRGNHPYTPMLKEIDASFLMSKGEYSKALDVLKEIRNNPGAPSGLALRAEKEEQIATQLADSKK